MYNNQCMKKAVKAEKMFLYLLLICFFMFFLFISRYAPVAGDDWGYALGGRYNNPFMKAWEFYHIWSGRFFSELWGFLVAPHKGLWNLLNPAIFTGVLYMLVRNSGTAKHPYLTPLIAAGLILSVPNGLRKQTYAWIMGTTYVIPLLLFLAEFYLVSGILLENRQSRAGNIIAGILAFMIPLYMENAAAMTFGFFALCVIYAWFRDRKDLKQMIVYLAISLAGLILIRYSPGAMSRMAREHAAFNALPLLQKMAVNWQSFLTYTYTGNHWLVLVLSIMMIRMVLGKESSPVRNLTAGVLGLGVLQSICGIVSDFSGEAFLLSGADTMPGILTVIYVLYTAALFAAVQLYVSDDVRKWKMTAALFCAGGANLVMLISPIFDIRSSMYTVFILILVCMMAAEETEIRPLTAKLLAAGCAALFLGYGVRYVRMYRLIHLIDIRRQAQLAYYSDHPEDTDAYVMAYPVDWVHSADVVEGDEYHLEFFRYYYELSDEIDIHFYYLEDYTAENILNG